MTTLRTQEGDYQLAREVHGAFLAVSPSGSPALLVPTTDERPPADRTSGSVSLSFRSEVRFSVKPSPFQASAAILVCLKDGLRETFTILAEDVAARCAAADTRPSPRLVSQSFTQWEELLRRRHALSAEAEIGLWGELWTMLLCPNLDRAVAAWRGPTGHLTDFAGGGIGIECKTGLRALEHHFSQDQLARTLGDAPIFIMSILVDRDEVLGRTINELVATIRENVAEPPIFERLLLQSGYSSVDATLYTQKLRNLEPPLWFPQSSVPRIQKADTGVTSIHFTASLDRAQALAPDQGIALLAQLSR